MKKILFLTLFLIIAESSVANKIAFSLKDLNQKTHHLSDYKKHWVLVNFWATWCPPCLEEMPDLSTLHDKDNNIIVLGINSGERDLEKIQQFADELLIDFPILLMPEHIKIEGIKPIQFLPTSLLIAPNGFLVGQFSGVVNIKALEKYIKAYRLY